MVNSGSLFTLAAIVLVAVAESGSEDRHRSRVRLCCIGVTNLDMSSEVVGETYREQAARHPCVKAVLFNTDNGKLCADPEAQWVKNLITKMTKV